MTWVKLDDGFADHPKVLRAGPGAAWVYVQGLCYASRHLTDGFIPEPAAIRMGTVTEIGRLLASGLWEHVDGGFQIHDYADHQRSKATVLKEREHGRARVEAFRERRKEQRLIGNGVTQALQVRPRVGNGVTSPGEVEGIVLSPSPLTSPSSQSIHRTPGPRPEPFKIPTFDELSAYIIAKNYSVDPSTFLAFYDSNGWKVGKNPMRSWKGALYTWHSRPR